MGEAITLRLLAAPDAPAYKRLRDEMLALHPTAFTSDAAAERTRPPASYLSRLGTDSGCFTLGAWRGASLVGTLSCERDARAKVRHVGHLIGMMVRAGFERQGIGRALLADCLARLRLAEGFELVTLSVTADNRRAVDLYERAGFRRYGTLPDAIVVDGQRYAKDLMVRKLD